VTYHRAVARLSVIQGDITTLDVDAIVNAANRALQGGGGVDGAIHRAAGPELKVACRPLAPCPTGEARITPGFALRAPWVIHAVGPVWEGGDHGEPAQLAACYRNSLALAAEGGLSSVAFPAISCGAYGYPLRAACAIAAATVVQFLDEHPLPERVVFCMFDARGVAAMRTAVVTLARPDLL
jgi:O-acetyl-ADP-ribose deacetylase (regulator of RNase III)